MTCEYGVPCPELNGKVLSGRTWEIYQGKAEGMTEVECEAFRLDWAGKERPQVDELTAMVQEAFPGTVVRTECVHLGEPTGERRLCRSCQGHVEVKLFACAVHGQCTTHKAIEGIACCPCPEYQARPPAAD